MYSMGSNRPEVCQLVAALVPKVQECREEFKAEEVSNSLHGLHSMSSDDKEVRDLLSALTPKVWECREDFPAEQVTTALYR